MRSLCLIQPKTFEFQDSPEPAHPSEDEALVAVRAIGVCGTDLSGYLGNMPFIQYPRILGHELGIEVLQVGQGVTNVSIGDRCSVEPYLNCGTCHPCTHGRSNCCEHLKVLGVHCDGGMTERLLVPSHKLHRSTELNFTQLALVETLAIGCHAVHRGGIEYHDNILILGAGPIGLATLEFARLKSQQITVVEPNETRRTFISQHYPGVSVVSTPPTDSSFHVVFDATGNSHSMAATPALASFGAKIVFVGITTAPVLLDDPLFHRRELSLLASRNALPSDFPRIIRLIESGEIQVSQWISHVEPLSLAPHCFAEITTKRLHPVKLVFTNPS